MCMLHVHVHVHVRVRVRVHVRVRVRVPCGGDVDEPLEQGRGDPCRNTARGEASAGGVGAVGGLRA